MIQLEPRSFRRGSRLCDLGPLERARYYGWWREYALLRRTAILGLLAWGVFSLLGLIQNPFSSAAKMFVWPALLIAVVAGIWGSSLDCPRCGERFHSGVDTAL